ncbi:MAG: hypothetical protein M3R30_04105 [Candidatus Eremiobacteraeota bacterium]|nr:hypothetical protein [Candidatus Eremiobacteraeota bacterium]
MKSINGCTNHRSTQVSYVKYEFVRKNRLTGTVDTIDRYAGRMRAINPNYGARQEAQEFIALG